MSNKPKRLGKGLKRDYRKDLLEENTQKSKPPDVQTSKSLEIRKSRRPTTMYLTKEQFRAVKEIQLQLLDTDLKIENSEIAGLGIEILKEILKNQNVQGSESLETLRARCLDVLRRRGNA